MMRMLCIGIISCLCLTGKAQSDTTGMKEVLDAMQRLYAVNFVYDSSLSQVKPAGTPVSGKPLAENLKNVLGGTGIRWEIKGDYVLLFRSLRYTFSGHVCQDNGESLMNVTVFDKVTQSGTLSNEHGFFSLTLPEGKHVIRFSYIGYQDAVKELELDADYTGIVYLKESTTSLEGVEVVGNLNSPLLTSQTGKVSLTPAQLNTEFSLLSSPDLVKTLQQLPGVSSGMELLSGLYVHGGKNDENLFLLDGTPLYQVNHVGGLFSAFHTDMVKNVDFYKSGFPARYGGRLSSVVDVRTKEGDMKSYHGVFSLGLLDGRIQWEGPIVKDKTSFCFGMRRSWADLFITPALLIASHASANDKIKARYAFHDINGKITHRFSARSKLSLAMYSGRDLFKIRVRQVFDEGTQIREERYGTDFNMQWGNLTATLAWNYQFTPKLAGDFSLVYARNLSIYDYTEDDRYYEADKEISVEHHMQSNRSTINDVGYRIAFDYRPATRHHIRFGSNYLHHLYRPQRMVSQDIRGTDGIIDTLSSAGMNLNRYPGNELSFYVEDEIGLSRKLRANIGAHYTLYQVPGSVYHSLEPRLSVSYRLTDVATLKASYTEMSQFVHQLSNSYLNLPTDCWVPSTRQVPPMRSRQVAGGIYMELPWNLHLDMEGYFRTTSHMLEYDTSGSLIFPAEEWERVVRNGKGKSYGIEAALAYQDGKNTFEAGYTLSWSLQKFEDFYPDWYFSKFDNRHKLNLMFRRKFNDRIDAYAAWTYRSGDRSTVPTQYVEGPSLPDVPGSSQPELVYEKPNNITLPAYHRLDVGINFRKTTKRGFERIWNVSIYNAYCRMNAFYTKVEQQPDGSFRGKGIGLFPIIPSFSYTLKF